MKITEFYLNAAPDTEGRYIEQIWQMSDEELLHGHDWVQWLFPLAEESMFNPDAPLLKSHDVIVFKSNPTIRGNLESSFFRFLKVLGLSWEEGKVVGNGDTWIFKTPNHNWLRFTRVIKSLSLCGLPDEALGLYDFLVQNTDSEQSKDSRPYWKAALES